MRCSPTPLSGLMVIESDAALDERGSFRRTWCAQSLAAAGIDFHPLQTSVSDNLHAHTLRGMHFQSGPGEEQKLVRCLRGEAWDVVIDLRPDSPTWGRSFALHLSADKGNALFIPRGFAHGFLTLQANTLLAYMIDAPYQAALARGLRWDDPAFQLDWPFPPQVISDKDRDWPLHA